MPLETEKKEPDCRVFNGQKLFFNSDFQFLTYDRGGFMENYEEWNGMSYQDDDENDYYDDGDEDDY